jgi:hypothetical protein
MIATAPVDASLRQHAMANELLVVSLGRILADEVRVEADEAHALIQHIWQHLRAQRANDGGLPLLPPLDAVGLSAFGDFQVRRSGTESVGVVRPPHQVARELADLLARLARSGRTAPDGAAAACLAVADRTLNRLAPAARPITAPDALLRALEAFRPRDASAALAALYARWMRATDSGRTTFVAPAPAGLALGIGRPRPVPAGSGTESAARGLAQGAGLGVQPPRLVFAPAVEPARREPRTAPVTQARPAPQPSRPAPAADTPIAQAGDRISTFTPTLPRTGPRRGFVPAYAGVSVALALVVGAGFAWRPESATRLGAIGRSALGGLVPASGAAATPAAPASASTTEPGRARQVLRAEVTGGPPYAPSFDPTTHNLVFHAGRERPALREAALDADGDVAGVSTVRVAVARSNHAQVSPDGQLLAFDSDIDGTRGVYVAARDGSNPRRVSGTGHALIPSWSPDGEWIAFARAETGKPQVWNVWTVHVPTGRLERRTTHRVGQPWGASWFPDGRRIAYNLEDSLIVLDLGTGRAETFQTPVPGRRVRTPAVSPDGTRIVFQVRDDGAWVLDLASGTPSRVLADASAEEFAWSPDGRRVAYHSLRGGEWGIWLLDLAP